MATTIAGTFENHSDAGRAIERLRELGVPAGDISLIARDTPASEADTRMQVRSAVAPGDPVRLGADPVTKTRIAGDEGDPATGEAAFPAAVSGAATGGLIGTLGGLLLGLGAMALPGIGPVVAAGPIAALLGGAVGAAAGSLVGMLVDAGLPTEVATSYSEDLERGRVLVAVRTDAASPAEVRDLFHQSSALNIYPPATTLV